MKDWEKELISRTVVILESVASEVETGAPFCQPQGYALAAIADCASAAKTLLQDGVTRLSVEVACLSIIEAAKCNRSCEAEQAYIAAANRIWKGFDNGTFERGEFPEVANPRIQMRIADARGEIAL